VEPALEDLMARRSGIISRIGREREPMKPAIVRIFGNETTEKIFDAISF
jgi:hypothetical protein